MRWTVNRWDGADTLYRSWYSYGVRVAELADPANPSERAYIIPPPSKDHHHVLGFVPEVWGVVVDEQGCVLMSDMNGGLFVAKETGAAPPVRCRGRSVATSNQRRGPYPFALGQDLLGLRHHVVGIV